MDNLKDILYLSSIVEVVGDTNIPVKGICFDSRMVSDGFLFVAVKGTHVNGHEYINKAIDNGAIAIVCEKIPENTRNNITYVKVKNSSKSLGHIAANYYDNPSENLSLIGITGTNGKSTTAILLFELFEKLGYKTGLISTVKNQIHHTVLSVTHTTPFAPKINELLNDMVEEGCEYCFMEVSSHAIDQNRIQGLKFKGAVFTNISHDHLDYHKTFKDYISVKKRFFDELDRDAFALTNLDDKQGRVILQNTKAQKKSYGFKTVADFKGKVLESSFNGLIINLDGEEFYSTLAGEFNAYNLLAVYATTMLLHQEKLQVLELLSGLKHVVGRFEQIVSDKTGVTGVIDYAHSPDALKNVLSTISKIRNGNEKVITVVGCGGDRDKQKRPVMAEIACKLSDQVIITSDNPRSEEMDIIIKEMQSGIPVHLVGKTLAINDRKEAIKTACTLATKGDIILIAGKGHEKYQEIKGVKYPFDDKMILLEFLNEKA